MLLLVKTRLSSFGRDCSRPSAIRLQHSHGIMITALTQCSPDSVVVSKDILESLQQWKTIQFANFIVGKVNGIKLVLKTRHKILAQMKFL